MTLVLAVIFKCMEKGKNGLSKGVSFHEVSDISNLENYTRGSFLLSEPKKFITTIVLIWTGAIIYAAATIPTLTREKISSMYPLIGLTFVALVASQIALIILGRTDPGMIPKVLPSY